MVNQKNLVPLAAFAVFLLVVAGFLAWRLTVLSTQPRALKDLYLEVSPPDAIALAPGGDRLVYAAPFGDARVLHLRRLDDGAVTRLEGTEGATDPFFSPDGRRLGFHVGGSVRELELDEEEGGASGSSPSGGDWILAERDDAVVASSVASDESRLLVAPAGRPRYLPPGYLLFLRDGGLWAARFDPVEAELLSEPFLAVEDVDGWYDVSATGTLAFRRPGEGARRRFAIVSNWSVELQRLAAGRW